MSSGDLCKKKLKRGVFSETDTELLVECVKKHSKVLNNKKTNGITPGMKSKVNFEFFFVCLQFL